MADRPKGSGTPEEGTPEYDWLYGSGSSGRQGPPPDDSTRVMPATTSDTPSGQRGGGGRPPRGPSRTTTAAPPPRPAPVRRRRFGLGWLRFGWLKLILLLWVVFMVAVPLWAWTKVEKVDAEPGGQRPAEQEGTTYLLVGSDSRDDLTEAERKELGTGGPVGQRTDTIMLLHTGSGPNLLMSIPRDSNVEVPERGVTKINAAFAYGGPELLVKTIEQNTGIRIDDYVQIGFGGFVGMVDAVGGIEICPKTAMDDPQANLKIEKGCQEADGKTALGYARSRKTSGLGDIDRARQQREVVSGVGSKALSPWTFINPVRYYELSTAAAESFTVGEGTSPISLAKFAFAMTRVDGSKGLTCGVPISDLAVTWDSERAPRLFKHIIEDDTEGIPDDLCTPTGMP